VKTVSAAELKNHLSHYVAEVEKGEVLGITRHNVLVAKVSGIRSWTRNRTILGTARGSVLLSEGLTEPFLPASDWDMLNDAGRH